MSQNDDQDLDAILAAEAGVPFEGSILYERQITCRMLGHGKVEYIKWKGERTGVCTYCGAVVEFRTHDNGNRLPEPKKPFGTITVWEYLLTPEFDNAKHPSDDRD